MSPKRNLTDLDLKLIEDLIDIKMDDRFEAFQKVFGPKQDKIITMLQELMGEVQAEREENIILENRSSQNKRRIKNVETHLGITTNA